MESGTQDATGNCGKITEEENNLVCTEVKKRDRSHEVSDDRDIGVSGMQREKSNQCVSGCEEKSKWYDERETQMVNRKALS